MSSQLAKQKWLKSCRNLNCLIFHDRCLILIDYTNSTTTTHIGKFYHSSQCPLKYHVTLLPKARLKMAGIVNWVCHSRPQSPSFLGHVVGNKLSRVALGTRMKVCRKWTKGVSSRKRLYSSLPNPFSFFFSPTRFVAAAHAKQVVFPSQPLHFAFTLIYTK